MREGGLVGASHRRGDPVTTQRDKEARPAPGLVDRNFTVTGPNQPWVADITSVPTMAGFLYLAVVLDAWSPKVVGWAMANHPRAELVLDAMAERFFSALEAKLPSRRRFTSQDVLECLCALQRDIVTARRTLASHIESGVVAAIASGGLEWLYGRSVRDG